MLEHSLKRKQQEIEQALDKYDDLNLANKKKVEYDQIAQDWRTIENMQKNYLKQDYYNQMSQKSHSRSVSKAQTLAQERAANDKVLREMHTLNELEQQKKHMVK